MSEEYSNKKITITINDQCVDVNEGITILEAARQHNIYIPTLCDFEGLTPFGGCRTCVVEIEEFNGLMTACTTPVSDGTHIYTDSEKVKKIRKSVLEMILSEHPTNCLFCAESGDCLDHMQTVRKGQATTGCRSCPQDGQCELQDVIEYVGLTGISLPTTYRNLEIEKYDPFYDRDYNLCILCGRCIRVCQEMRLADVLAFKQRGHVTRIGPSFERTHLEADCEFCGACLTVCPTGTLSEKTRKWDGKPEKTVTTTCPFCSIGCQIDLLVKNGEVIGSLPANNGQLCVKGRFSVYELLNNSHRLNFAYRYEQGFRTRISQDEAIDRAADLLAACSPEKFGLMISANCTNEDLYIAQKFVRKAMNSHHIDSSIRQFYGTGLDAYIE
nr:(2Fe-2S)-binding protein [Anaerolineaceae bacterium]